MKRSFKVAAAVLLFIAQTAFGAPYSDPNKTKMIVAAATPDLNEIVAAIGGNYVDVKSLMSADTIYEDFKITSSTVALAKKSNLVLFSGEEKWAGSLKNQAGAAGRIYKTLAAEGNLMIAYIRIRAAEEIRTILSSLDEENASHFEENYTNYAYAVNFAASQAKTELADAYGVKVISNANIRTLLESFGFDVVAVYSGRELTPRQMSYLLQRGKTNNIRIVVDNLQAGAFAGRNLADEIGAKHVAISNSTLGKSYVNTLRDNVKRLKDALQKQ